MSIAIVEREGTYLLGSEDRPDQLIEWSLKGSPGQRFVKDFPFGLRLGFVRDGEHPKVYIHWNQGKFDKFLRELCTQERFVITSYGICVTKRHGHTLVKLLGAGQTSQVLWDSEHNEFSQQHAGEDVNWLVGMIRLSDNGPMFYTTPETQAELEESSAVAVISLDKNSLPTAKSEAKQPGEVIKKPQLSDKARAFLLQSVLSDNIPASHGK